MYCLGLVAEVYFNHGWQNPKPHFGKRSQDTIGVMKDYESYQIDKLRHSVVQVDLQETREDYLYKFRRATSSLLAPVKLMHR